MSFECAAAFEYRPDTGEVVFGCAEPQPPPVVVITARDDMQSTVRAVQILRWDRDDAGIAVMTIQADAFCHSMVRSLVGALLPVGEGRRPVTWPGEVLRSGAKDSAVTTMPAHPLVLAAVGSPPDDQLLLRQRETRSLRTLES